MVYNEWASTFLFIGKPPWKAVNCIIGRWLGQLEFEQKEPVKRWIIELALRRANLLLSALAPSLFHSVNIYWPSSMYQALCWALEIQPVKPPAPWRMARLPRLDLLLPSPMPSIFGSVKISTFCYHTLWLLHQLCWGYWLAKAFIIPQSQSSLEETSRLGLKCFCFPQLQTLSQIFTLMEFILSALIF